MKKIKLKIIYIIIFFIITILAFDIRLKTVFYDLESTKINNNIKMALITDLHSCKYGKNQKTLINAINKQNPDLVLLSGDIFDDNKTHNNTIIFLETISKKYPCYYVTGNHEFRTGEVQILKDLLKSFNINVLEGNFETINVKNNFINIAGVDDPDISIYLNNKININQQLKNIDDNIKNNYYTILLSHRPELIEKYNEYNFDLVLCGHAHGGQWRIPYLLNGFLAPHQGFFPKYAGGRYTFDNKEMIVSRGLARETTIVPRIFNRPELVIINLK